VSREVIADSIETVVGAEGFDGFVAIGGCDKNIPGCAMAIARMNRPAVFVYGGTIRPGANHSDIVSVFEAVGARAAGKISDEQLREVERLANEEIRRDDQVQTEVLSLDEAMEKGAIGLFEEKYGDQVRMVSIPGFSMELCGGTHTRATGQIGELVIASQESVGSGVRRIEALTGRKAAEYVRERLDNLRAAAQVLPGTSEAELPKQIQRLLEELSKKDKQIERLKREGSGAEGEELVSKLRSANGETQVLAETISADTRQDLLTLIDRVKTLRFSGVVTLGAVLEGKPAFVTHVTKDLVGRGVQAGDIVREASLASGGRGGGGRPDLAQGGGTDPDKLQAGLDAAIRAARERLDQ
jgi:alanyl-tRNA synthetase